MTKKMEVTEEIKRKVWEKGLIAPGYPKDQVRKDACGAWILWKDYEKHDSPFGWVIDHIYPLALYKLINFSGDSIDNIINLRPLHHRNNMSKGTDYPTYQAVVKALGDRNIDETSTFEVNIKVQNQLKDLLHV